MGVVINPLQGWAFIIIKKKSENFSRKDIQVISSFTLLAGADIEVLTILEPKFKNCRI